MRPEGRPEFPGRAGIAVVIRDGHLGRNLSRSRIRNERELYLPVHGRLLPLGQHLYHQRLGKLFPDRSYLGISSHLR
jgi:NhaP-type Na+/H+ and K+/H+ antiporter